MGEQTERLFPVVDFSTHVILKTLGEYFIISRLACELSELLRDLLEEDIPERDSELIIPLNMISGNVLKYIIMYLEHYSNPENTQPTIPKPMKPSLKDIVSLWDMEFIYTDLVKDGNENQCDLLIDCINAVDFMSIPKLTDLLCGALAEMIKGKSIEQLRELFKIINDFTLDEEKRIKEENKFCDEPN